MSRRHASSHPRGAVLLIAMVCVAVWAAVTVSTLRLVAAQHAQLRRQQWQMQADWLARAGLERAVAQLREDLDYAGETWTVSAGELKGRHKGTVRIEVTAVAERSELRQVAVVADYPDEPIHRARRTRVTTLRLPADNEEEE